MDVLRKGREVSNALDGLQPPGEVANTFQTREGRKSKHVKMVLLGASFDPQQKQIDGKSRLTCLNGLHGCFREGA